MTITDLDNLGLERLVHCSAQDLSGCSTKSARNLISFSESLKAKLLPLGVLKIRDDTTLLVAVSDESYETHQLARYISNMEVKTVSVDSDVLLRAIFIAYKKDGSLVEETLKKCDPASTKSALVGMVPGLQDVNSPENNLLCSLFDHALAWNASDLHIAPTKQGLSISMRVSGEVRSREATVNNQQLYERVLKRIKVVASLDTIKKGTVQEGTLVIPFLDTSITARVSMVPSLFGESLAIRFLRKDTNQQIADLNYSAVITEALLEIAKHRNGLILISGATGSGKTTTLYGLIQEILKNNRRVVTLEDPVETIIAGATQVQIDNGKGLTFVSGLKAILRQDPDVIVIGEIRESAVAGSAVQAAMSGHLVIATIHAGSIQETAQRMEAFCESSGTGVQTIRGIIFQQLVKNNLSPETMVPIVQIAKDFQKKGSKGGKIKESQVIHDNLDELVRIGILSQEDYTRLYHEQWKK